MCVEGENQNGVGPEWSTVIIVVVAGLIGLLLIALGLYVILRRRRSTAAEKRPHGLCAGNRALIGVDEPTILSV
jgi:LPXTG-motif cell wall-anchored protein